MSTATCPGDGCELQACPDCTASDRIADVARDVQAWINSHQSFGDVEIGFEGGGDYQQLTLGDHAINVYGGESTEVLVDHLALTLASDGTRLPLARWHEGAIEFGGLIVWASDQMPFSDWQDWAAGVAADPECFTAAYIAYRSNVG